MSIFELLPENHFGITNSTVRKDIDTGESSIVYGMYGAGIQYFLRLLEFQLLQEKKHTVLFFRGALFSDDPINDIVDKISPQHTAIKSILESYRENRKLIIMIDSFQMISKRQQVLQFLESIRKTNPQNIVNILGSDHSYLSILQSDIAMYPGTVGTAYQIPLFDQEGTKRIIQINNKFYAWEIPDSQILNIHQLSGGNPRLIKYICKVVMQDGIEMLNKIDLLIQHPAIEPKLITFIEILFTFNIQQLKQLQIIDDKGAIFSKLLDFKLQNYEIRNIQSFLPQLTRRERTVFSFLYLNKGRVVPVEKLDFIMNLTEENYSLWASYKAITRLRKKIENQFTLVNYKGQGYMLNQKDV